MNDRANAFLRHQQARWLRPDAARWVRPDAAKFLKPGTRAADVYPALAQQRDALQHAHDREIADAIAHERMVLAALRAELAEINSELQRRKVERKYNEDQPRVAAGNSDGGQWTSGSGGSGRPRVYITGRDAENDEIGEGGFGDSGGFGFDVGNVIGDVLGEFAREIDKLDLFDIKPKKPRSRGVRLAGDPPRGIGDNGGPPLGVPPDIPRRKPKRSEQRTAAIRSAATWIGRAVGLGVAIDVYNGILNNIEWLKERRAEIETYRDPPRTYEELMDAVNRPRPGTEKHHTAEQTAMERFGFSRREINALENLVRIPTLKHYDITAWYGRPNDAFGGLTPRQYLADKPLRERMRVGRDALIIHKVLKP